MHDLHFACNYDGFGTGFWFLVLFVMLWNIYTKIKEHFTTLGLISGGVEYRGNGPWCAPPHAKSQTTDVDRNEQGKRKARCHGVQ